MFQVNDARPDVVTVNQHTAHPHVEKDGSVINLGTAYRSQCMYGIIKMPPPEAGNSTMLAYPSMDSFVAYVFRSKGLGRRRQREARCNRSLALATQPLLLPQLRHDRTLLHPHRAAAPRQHPQTQVHEVPEQVLRADDEVRAEGEGLTV